MKWQVTEIYSISHENWGTSQASFQDDSSWRLTGPMAQFGKRTSVSVCNQTTVLYIDCTYKSEAPRSQEIHWRRILRRLIVSHEITQWTPCARNIFPLATMLPNSLGLPAFCRNIPHVNDGYFVLKILVHTLVHKSNTTNSDTDKDSNFALNNKTRVFL